MHCHPIRIALLFFSLVGTIAPGTHVAAEQTRSNKRISFVEPFEYVSGPDPSSMLGYKFADLAKVDPDDPLSDEALTQTLSLFGREDLIASRSSDFKSRFCVPLTNVDDPFAEIVNMARATSIVIINESHERSEHRAFIAEVARRLRSLGYDTLAVETLTNSPSDTPQGHLPLYIRQPELPYFADGDGWYLSESGFGRLGRAAKTLGYRLLPYEPILDDSTRSMTIKERIARREEGQAHNLATFMKQHPAAKILIHVGYSHAAEVPRADGATWMAARLKAKTGINPLTVSQTTCRGSGNQLRLSALPADEPLGTFDLIIDHPNARFQRRRPAWRKLVGDEPVKIPRSLRPATGWRVIEARPLSEPNTSVPLDRVAIRARDDIALMLPPGKYRLRIIDVPSAKARSIHIDTDE